MNTNITITDRAVQHVEKYFAKQGKGAGIRVSIDKTGCSGYAYVVDFVDVHDEADSIFPLNDALSIFVAADVFEMIKGSRIDYVTEGLKSGFKFLNPNQTGECGCGESFTVN